MNVLGLDIGIASVGWALLNFENGQVMAYGVRAFDAAEQPKTGASLAEPRRVARGVRRSLRRRAGRMRYVRDLLSKAGLPVPTLPTKSELGDNPHTEWPGKGLLSPWQLRAKGLDRCLLPQEWAQVLVHFAKHRGFKSNKKGEGNEDDTEGGKVLKAVSGLNDALLSSKCRTVGELLWQTKGLNGEPMRNKEGRYDNCLLRDLQEQEIRLLFERQRALGNPTASDTLESSYLLDEANEKGVLFQWPLKSVADKVGFCELEPTEKRLPKLSRTAELFRLWQHINHLRLEEISPIRGGGITKWYPVLQDRQAIYALVHSKKEVTYKDIRKVLDLAPHAFFANLTYDTKDKAKLKALADEKRLKRLAKKKGPLFQVEEDPTVHAVVVDEQKQLEWELLRDEVEKRPFFSLDGTIELKVILGNPPSLDDTAELARWDTIVEIMSVEMAEKRVEERLSEEVSGLSDDQVFRLKKLSGKGGNKGKGYWAGAMNNGPTALRKIAALLVDQVEPDTGKPFTYDMAKKAAGYSIKKESAGLQYLPPFPEITNPVVRRSLAQVRKVINGVIAEYWMPDQIHVELAREASHSRDERNKLGKEMEANRQKNERAYRSAINDFGLHMTPLKVKLWHDQGHLCPYTLTHISRDEMEDATATQIDHILPYSRSFNNSYANKVLCKTKGNQDKQNQTPWEFFQNHRTPQEWERLEAHIAHWDSKKTANLLNKTFGEDETGFKDRNMNDTRYICRLTREHIRTQLDTTKVRKVLAVKGGVTSFLRKEWGLEYLKKDTDGNRVQHDRHHVLDAIMVACADEALVQRVARYDKWAKRRSDIRDDVSRLPEHWPTFIEEVKAVLDTVFVSRLIKRKHTGEICGPNPKRLEKSPLEGQPPKVLDRLALQKLTLAKLERLVDKESGNKWLYETLKVRLQAAGDDPVKAFAFDNPVYLKGKDGQPGPQVRKVALMGSVESGQLQRGGLVSNGDQVRVNVYEKGGKFYLAPVYAYHVLEGQVPMAVIKAATEEKDWPQLNDSYQFVFSLYPNEFVQLVDKNGEVTEGYYIGTHRTLGQIGLRSHDKSPRYLIKDTLVSERNFGVQGLQSFMKVPIDVLGTRGPVIERETPDELAYDPRATTGQTTPSPTSTDDGGQR